MVSFDKKNSENSDSTETIKAIITLVFVVVTIAAIAFGGWQLGWWFKAKNVDRQAHMIRNSYSNQQTLRDQITKNLSDVDMIDIQLSENPPNADQLTAQQHAIKNIVCADAEQITGDPLPVDQNAWTTDNCKNGHAE